MEQRAVVIDLATPAGARCGLHLPAREAWGGFLALVGCDSGSSSPAWPQSDGECLALRRRGVACAPLGDDLHSSAAVLAAAHGRMVRDYGTAPRRVLLFGQGRAARVALELAASQPGDVHGVVVIALTADDLDLDLQPFAAAGGRLIVAHGIADRVAPVRPVIDWFERLERRAGGPVQASGYARLFLWPDVGHDLLGGGCGEVDWLTHIERWLERVPPRPPDDPVAVRRRPGARPARSLFAPGLADPEDTDASRPAYPYPLRTIYKGRGDPGHWENWYAPAVYRRTPEPLRADELPRPLPPPPATTPPPAWPVPKTPVAVFGASGRLGSALLEALSVAGMRRRAVVRDPRRLAAAGLLAEEVATADVRDAAAVDAALAGATYAIFAASATAGGSGDNTPGAVEYQGLVNVVEAARRHRLVRLVLVSSAACTQREHIHNLWGGILECKARAEEYLRRSGVPYTVLRPTGLRLYPGGQRGIRLVQGDRIAFGEEICREDVATLCVAALADPGAAARTFEAYNDDSLAPGTWRGAFGSLRPD
jgi:uncharacterized protein YbjT (DUF2867 family)